MTDSTPPAAPPGTLVILAQSVRPSVRRAVASLFSAFSLPLLVLSALSVVKLLGAAGLVDVSATLAKAIGLQAEAVEQARRALLRLGVGIAPWVFDALLISLLLGNATARAEADELLAVDYPAGERWALFKRGLARARTDLLLIAIPCWLRGLVVRLVWPLVTLYRLHTPWVVEGPGPTGDAISTSVPGCDLARFAGMVSEAGTWAEQTVYDHRQVLIWQIAFGLAAALALNAVLKAVAA